MAANHIIQVEEGSGPLLSQQTQPTVMGGWYPGAKCTEQKNAPTASNPRVSGICLPFSHHLGSPNPSKWKDPFAYFTPVRFPKRGMLLKKTACWQRSASLLSTLRHHLWRTPSFCCSYSIPISFNPNEESTPSVQSCNCELGNFTSQRDGLVGPLKSKAKLGVMQVTTFLFCFVGAEGRSQPPYQNCLETCANWTARWICVTCTIALKPNN